MTKSEQAVVSEKTYAAALVDRDSRTRWASGLAVQLM